MDKRLVLPGGILWIAGLVMSIVGMNLHTDTGRLVAIIGNIGFLVGLGIFGAAWLMARKSKDSEKQED
jgi:purine-cytosine permease-like protein